MAEVERSQAYIIRSSGEKRVENIVSGGFFAWLYNDQRGIKLRPWLMENRVLHFLIEKFADNPLSRHLVPGFAEKARINLGESERPVHRYKSLNDFFTRKLKAEARPINQALDVFTAPGDGKLLVFPTIDNNQILPIKGLQVSLGSLLGSTARASAFAGGSAMVLRLYLMDYHRIHFPCDGTVHRPQKIRGHYYSVSPVLGNDVNFYSCNKRTRTNFTSVNFGKIAFVDIGGFLIASIKHLFKPETRVKKGDEKSLFQFGGSTLVVLFEKNRIKFDQDLMANSDAGAETYVKLGEAIGRIPSHKTPHSK